MVFTSVTPTDLTKVFAEDVKTTVYFYNASNWSGVGIHGYNDSVSGQYTGDWNTTFMEKDGDTGWYKYEINADVSKNYIDVIFFDKGDPEGDHATHRSLCKVNDREYVYFSMNGAKYCSKLAAEVALGKVESSKVKNAFSGTKIAGNVIEAEDHDNKHAEIIDETKTDYGQSGTGNIAHVNNGTWTMYNVNFNRAASKFTIRYSAKSTVAGGTVNVYLDSMDSTPVATVEATETGSEWSNFVYKTVDANIPSGIHQVYLKYSTSKDWCTNVDCFYFESPYVDAVGTHEIENAHETILGPANGIEVSSSGNFSNKAAIGGLNTWEADGRAYTTTYVNAKNAGTYTLKLKYSLECGKDTRIDYRINGDTDRDWRSWTLKDHSSSWDEVKEFTTTVSLKKGINAIDITGAVNTGTDWKWVRLDNFELSYVSENNYSKKAFSSRENVELNGVQLDAGPKSSGNIGGDEGGKLTGIKGEGYAEYDVYFDRKASGVTMSYSVATDCGGTVEMYVDSMSGAPVTTFDCNDTTGGWSAYVTKTVDVNIPDGNHKIYFKVIPRIANSYSVNLGWFKFAYTPEEMNIRHEAENAHAYTKGSASGEYSLEVFSNYSGKTAIGGMNTWPKDGRAYLTQYVNVKEDGCYNIVVGYANGGEYDTNIDVRVNSSDDSAWKSISAPKTGGWNSVGEIKATVELKAGVNYIDITGASNILYNKDNAWQQVNIDYFDIEDDNIAKGKKAYAESEQKEGETVYPADNAVDGDSSTRWANNNEGGWIYVDLESLYEIERVEVLFETAYAKSFEIQTSKDGKIWVTSKTVSSGDFIGDKNIKNDGTYNGKVLYTSKDTCLGKARYVRIKANEMNSYHKKMSIYELKVYGTKVPGYLTDVAVNKDITCDSASTVNPAKYATDGKDTTKWTAGSTHPEYTIDLGREYGLRSIDLKYSNAYAKSFKIATSNDGTNWKDLKNVSQWTEPGSASGLGGDKILGYSFHFDEVKARYVKLYVDECADTSLGISLYEFEVWAKDNQKSDYWNEVGSKSLGVYPVSKLQDTKYENSVSDTYPLGVIDSSLVTGDILLSGDTYEVVYDSDNRNVFFYVNPRDINVDYDKQEVFWSNGNSGAALWGADNHDENIAKYIAKQQATVQYQLPENLDFGDSDYVTTQIGCRIYNRSDIGTDGYPVSGAKPVFSIKFNLKILNSHGIYIEDSIMKNGTLNVKNAGSDTTYSWEKSEDGKNWQTVSEKRKDVQVISNNGASVNVADDLGGGYYYRVKAENGKWSQPYYVQYYNNVQNGDFEFPAMFSHDEEKDKSMDARFPYNSNGDEQQYPNGFDGLFWKTTGPGYYNTRNRHKTTHDIEIVNGRNLRTDSEAKQQVGFSVSQKDMYGDNSHGDQFAELNCEEQGALYQDILTTPGSECYWDLDHAARRVSNGATNSMLVVAMSTNDALNYTKDTEIEKIVNAAKDQGVTGAVSTEYENGKVISLDNGVQATVWKVTSTATAGEWKHNSGKYTVPVADKNYLTRFFFVSIDGTDGNRTIGNLLDNVTFEQKKQYKIKYVVNGEEVYTTTGIVAPYDRVDIPDTLPEDVKDSDGNHINLSEYTLKESNILKYKRDSEGNIIYDGTTPRTEEKGYYIDNNDRRFTVAYDHDTLILYYQSGIVTLTKRVEGLTEIPDDYKVKLTVKDGNNEKYTKTFAKSDFTAIDNADDEKSDSFFATVSFEAAGVLNSGKKYTVTEEEVKTMIGTSFYLSQVTAGKTVNSVPVSELSKTSVSYSGTAFVYNPNTDNSELFVNTYKPTHKVTIEKKVAGNMGEQEKLSKSFSFTAGIALGMESVNAVLCTDTSVTNSEKGKYKFNLKDGESISFIVYDGCAITVTEQKEEWYSTTYTVGGVDTSINKEAKVEDNFDPFVTTNAINKDVNILCTNTSEDLGDVEVQGYQMNVSNVKGAPAEFSPSFRVVCRVSKNTIKRRKVVKAGVIFGTANAVGTGADAVKNLTIPKSSNLNNDGTAGAEKDGVDGKIKDNIYYHEETTGGYYGDWTTRENDPHPYTHWNYYALTFYATSYMYGMLTQNLTYRAYAVVEGTVDNYDYQENGNYYKYEYGNDIYTINMYEIARNLYENQKMSTQTAHNYLYNNVLNIVNMDKNRLNIANAMMVKLNIKSKDHNYNLVNACYKSMYDYVHCLGGYKYSQRESSVPNKDFAMKKYNTDGSTGNYNKELLEKLNTASGTNYDTLSQWIYYEVEKTEVNKSPGKYYTGYYRMSQYSWNNGIITDYDVDEE